MKFQLALLAAAFVVFLTPLLLAIRDFCRPKRTPDRINLSSGRLPERDHRQRFEGLR